MLSNYVQEDAPIETANSADRNVNMNVGVGVGVDALSLVQSAVVQVVQQAAVMMSNDTAIDAAASAAATYEVEEEVEELFLTETEFALLSHATTTVGDFDPFSEKVLTERPNFIPILEGRGGTDKDEQGHRRDTLPIANAINELETNDSRTNHTKTAVFQFLEENDGLSTHAVMSNDALKKYLKKVAHGIIVRINPGTLSTSTQKKCDDMLRELSSDAGIKILSHPDVTSSLGAKDSLVKIKSLKCGLEDTEVYYTPESFSAGFRTTIAFQPRVIKQNRGSQGEGIWIVKLKDESSYCTHYGETMVSLDTELVLMEAFDNHVEYHTVGEFIDFCIYGRLPGGSAVEWTTTSAGKYFDGGLAAGAMVVDQRFLPRIVEGEVRCLMVGSELVEIVHKKPAEGGLSATLQSGATYTKFAPDHSKFAKLVENFKEDIPHIMDSFGMSDEPLPLLWTADYIYGETDDDLHVGEINCSCVGITQQLSFCPIVAEVAVRAIFER